MAQALSSSTLLASVVIPAHNEADCIARTIQAILNQANGQGAVEVIVVDDGSSDATCCAAEAAGALVIKRRSDTGSPAAARNLGARAARGDPLIFLDADCLVTDAWLKAILAAHQAGETIVAGALDMPTGLSLLARCDYYCGWYLAHSRRQRGYVPHAPAPNLSVRRAAFFQSSGFEEVPYNIASEERKWQAELRAQGHRIYFEPDAVAYHYNRPGLGNLMRRNYRWGYAAIESKAKSGTARLAWLYRYPYLLVAASLPLAPVHAAYIVFCWLRAGKFEPLLLLPLVLLSRLAYSYGMMRGGIQWLRGKRKKADALPSRN